MLTGKLFSESFAAPASGVAEFVLNLECAEQNCAATFGGDRLSLRYWLRCARHQDERHDSRDVRGASSVRAWPICSTCRPSCRTTRSTFCSNGKLPPPPPLPPSFSPLVCRPRLAPLFRACSRRCLARRLRCRRVGCRWRRRAAALIRRCRRPTGAPDNTVTIVIAVVVGLVVCLLIVLAIVYVVVRNRNQQQTYPYPNDPYATSQHSMMVGNNQPPHSMMIQQQQFGTQQQYSSTGYQSSNSTLPQMNGYAGGSHVQPYADMPSGHHTAASFSQQPAVVLWLGLDRGHGCAHGAAIPILCASNRSATPAPPICPICPTRRAQ
jgi:hypothetical protein